MPNQKIIDWTLGKELAGGNEKLSRELMDMLIESLPEHRHEIDIAMQKQDWTLLAKAAHKLHGAACYCGTPRLKEAAKKLEITAKEKGDSKYLEPLYKTLHKEMGAVEKTLTSE